MKIVRSILTLLFGIVCLYQPHSFALIVGNKTAVFIIPNSPIFPAGAADNTMLGFGYFQGGFTLQDATTSCTFSSVFPVSGIVNMNGGTLHLLEDLIITNTVQLQGLGKIIGNNHTIEFCESITSLPSDFTLIKDVNLYFRGSVDLNSSVAVQGNCHIHCSGNTINFKNGSGLVIGNNANLAIQDAVLENVGTTNITCADNTGQLQINNTTIALAADWTFAQGSIHFKNSSSMRGSYIFNYTSNLSSVIETLSTLFIDKGVEFIIGKATLSTPEPLIFEDNSSVLSCGRCTLHITHSGVQMTHGTLMFENNTVLESDSTDPAYGIIFGNSPVADDDFTVIFGAGCNTVLLTGAITYNNVSPNKFLDSATSSVLTVLPEVTLYCATTCNLPANTFVTIFNGVSFFNLIFGLGQTLNANNTQLTTPGYGNGIYTGYYQEPYGAVVVYLDTNDSIYLSSGTPGNVTVTGPNNIIAGTGFIQTPLILTSTSASLYMNLQGPFEGPIDLNGGTITLLSDFSQSSNFLSSGTIDLSSYTMTRKLPAGDSTFVTPLQFKGTQGTLSLIQDFILSTTWTFEGSVTIDGNGNTLDIGNGQISASADTQVTLKNIKITNIKAASCSAASDSSIFVLDNTSAVFAEDFTLSHGTCSIKNDVLFRGPYKFTHIGSALSEIQANSVLQLNGGLEFYFGRATPGGAEPIILTTKSSILQCKQCTLHINENGAQLTRGKLDFDGSVIIETDSTTTTEGFIWGNANNSSDPEDDLEITLGAGCLATMQAGALVYNNVKGNGFANSATSSLFTLYPHITFGLATSCTLPQNTFVIATDGISLPTLLFAPGTALYLDNTIFSIPGVGSAVYKGHFDYTYGINSFFMETNDSIYLSNGSLVIPTRIQGASNQISGNGSISRPVIFTNQAASSTLRLQGSIDSYISLAGGTLTLLADTNLTVSNCFLTTGTISLDGKTLILQPPAPSTYTVPVYWNGTSGTIQCTQDITLTTTWTFIGNTVLDLGGNSLNFEGGALLVAPGASLTIKNAHLNNIVQSSILCADNTGSITLYNATWSQADDYAFVYGSLNYKGTVFMTGADLRFTYMSTETSTLSSDTTLELDNLFTFAYAPSNNATNLMQFTDFTSKFALNHSVLYITPGLHLTKGQLTLQQAPTIYPLGTGLTLGDMTVSDSSADMHVTFLDNSETSIQSGIFSYQNGLETSWQCWTSANLALNNDSSIYVYRSIPYSQCTILFNNNNAFYAYRSACPIFSDILCSISGSYDPQDLC